jgi:hypothetical protein
MRNLHWSDDKRFQKSLIFRAANRGFYAERLREDGHEASTRLRPEGGGKVSANGGSA